MNQSVNIFRKDVGQLWPQVVMPTITLTFFTVLESRNWGSGPSLLFSTSALTRVLVLLFCMSWGVLLISLVQAERLVGLNQFWTTRPYEWSKLIAAKCLFLLAFLYLPLVGSQIALLYNARLPVAQSVPALLYNLLVLTAVFVLPLFCAAALTRSTAQAMAVFLVLVSVLVDVASISKLLKDLVPRSLLPLQITFIAAVLLAALINQYWRRTTRRSLYILALAPVLILLTQVTVPGTSLATIGYASPIDGSSISVRFDSDPLRATGSSVSTDPDRRIYLQIPLVVSGIDRGTSFSLDGHRLALAGANGYRWQSSWLSASGMLRSDPLLGELTAYAEFPIPRSVYDRLRDDLVTVQIDFALTQLQDQPPILSTLSTIGDSIPALGFCALDQSYSVINCRSAFQEPSQFAIQTYRQIPCTAPGADVEPAIGMVGDFRSTSALPHISSVVVTGLPLSAPRRAGYLCPGAPIKFVEKRFERRLQIRMPVATLQFKGYVGSDKIK